MGQRFLAGVAMLVCVLLGLWAANGPAANGKEESSKDLFGTTRTWNVHLEIPAKEYEAMQPAPGGFGFSGGPPAPPARREGKEKRDSERNLFGTEFPWVQGDLSAEGKTWKKVGVRYAGDITYFASSRGPKRPLKIQFDKFAEQHFHGLASLQLHAMPMDPAKGGEALAFSAFRAAGVPAPRTAFAEVRLSVPGKYDKELLGLYCVVEDVDKRFLQDRFGTEGGLLMKPFGVRSVEGLGDDWERYKGQYRPQGEATREQSQRVLAFARLVHQASDDEFNKEIDSFLDVDEFLRFLAANALTSNLQSAFALGHNYSLYLNPKTNKFVFLPGDLEFALANFLLMGSADQLMDLSLTRPYPGDHKLVERLLAARRHLARPGRRHRPGGLRHRPAQSLRHRHRSVHGPVHPRQQRQSPGRLGHPGRPPDAGCLLRLLAALRQLPRRDHAPPGAVRWRDCPPVPMPGRSRKRKRRSWSARRTPRIPT
jgi:hypothetical protein